MEAIYKFYLLSNDSGESILLKQNPIGWQEQKYNIIRDLRYFGIFKKISVEFSFVGDGYDFLQRQQLLYGTDANVILRIYKENQFLVDGKINFIMFRDIRKFNQFKVDIIQSDLIQKFTTREDMKLNILNNISLDGKAVTPAALKNILFRGKQINFFSEFKDSSLAQPEIYHHILPFKILVNGNPGVKEVSNISLAEFEEDIDEELYTKDNSFYINNLPTDQTIQLKFDINYTLNYAGVPIPYLFFDSPEFQQKRRPKVVYTLVVLNAENDIVDTLFTKSYDSIFGNFTDSFDQSIVVPPGFSLLFSCERHTIRLIYEDGDLSQTIDVEEMWLAEMDTILRTEITYNSMSMTISQDSIVSNSTTPVILPHELFSNLFAQINGCEFYSEFFGRVDLGYDEDGPGAYLSITTGQLLRGIDPLTVQIPTSIRDAFTSYSAVYCLGMVIQKKRVIVEPLDNLFNANISTNLGEVREFVNTPAIQFLFNSVQVGYPKNEYEQQNGRDEFNTQALYTNGFGAAKKELNLVSIYFGDGYGAEFARRANIKITGTSDSRYDDQIFFLDLVKDIDGNLMTRRQEGILLAEGIFSSETAINLNIAVEQNMLRWSKFLTIPLDRKPDKSYFFQNKDKNSKLHLVTALGETQAGETISLGKASYFIPEERQFESPITITNLFEILANPLGRVAYTYEGERFYDYLFEVDMETEKHKGPWRMLGTKATPVLITDEVWGNFLKYGEGPKDYVRFGMSVEDILEYQ